MLHEYGSHYTQKLYPLYISGNESEYIIDAMIKNIEINVSSFSDIKSSIKLPTNNTDIIMDDPVFIIIATTLALLLCLFIVMGVYIRRLRKNSSEDINTIMIQNPMVTVVCIEQYDSRPNEPELHSPLNDLDVDIDIQH